MMITLVSPDHSIMLQMEIGPVRGEPYAIICGGQVFVARADQPDEFEQKPFINLDEPRQPTFEEQQRRFEEQQRSSQQDLAGVRKHPPQDDAGPSGLRRSPTPKEGQ